MYEFDYHRPESLDEAVALLGQGDDASALAGGQTLLQTLKQRLAQPSALVDLGGIAALAGIREEHGRVVVGATTCHREVADSALVGRKIPALARLAARIGDPQVRNAGTLGGSIANNDPAADYPAGVLGLGATVRTDRRELAADDFFVEMFETALEPGELVTAVAFPVPDRAAYVKFAQPASRFALVGVMVSQRDDEVRVAVTGAGPRVFRIPEMERALGRSFSPEAIAGIGVEPDGLNADIHATPAYRAHLVGVLARRAVDAALAGP